MWYPPAQWSCATRIRMDGNMNRAMGGDGGGDEDVRRGD